ncbi:MAG: DUF1796 family putative cysteine peptidase [Akkermansia sp.]
MKTGTAFDQAYNIGDSCAAALWLRRCRMRFSSGPLDWLAGGSFSERIGMIVSDFARFMEAEDLEYVPRDVGEGISSPHDLYRNRSNGLKHYHDFKMGLPLAETYPAVRAKYDRRIKRLQNVLATQRVLLVWLSLSQITDDAELVDSCERLLQKYAHNRDNIHFLIIEQGTSAPEYKRLNAHIECYRLDLANASQPDFNATMGNLKCIEPVFCRYDVQHSRLLRRRQKRRKMLIRLMTLLIPIRSIRRNIRRKLYDEPGIQW